MLEQKDVVLVEETGAGRFQVRVSTSHSTLLADEPVNFGGLGSGPNPFDLICASLGACTAMTVRLYAERKGWLLARLQVRVRHSKTGSNAQDTFERVISFGGGVGDDQQRRLLEIAGRCPVHRLLERGATITTQVEPLSQAAEPLNEGLHASILEQLCNDAG